MKRSLMLAFWIIALAGSAPAQERLYPVLGKSDVPAIMTSDRSSFVVEKFFKYKITLGFPNDDRAEFLPGTRARIVALWMRIQNISPDVMDLNPSKFTSTDDRGKVYPALTTDDAFKQIMAGSGDTPVVSKTLRGISLGRVGGKASEDEVREDMERYSIKPEKLVAGDVSEGLIYFEAPEQKKFTLSILLGDLWSKPFVFSNTKQK